MKFLIVDDDIISRMTLAAVLKPYGDTQEAVSADEAMKILVALPDAHRLFDAIFLDVKMPGISGLECLEEIRKFETEQGVEPGDGFKIIMATSDDAEQTILGSFTAQCDGYVVKPFDGEKVVSALRMADIPIND